MVTIKIIIGSTRPNRFAPQPAAWLLQVAQAYKDIAKVEVVDLVDINLPLLDEPQLPSVAIKNEHTLKWSKIISEADGFVFISPEYNHSYSPSLKNAIDFLSNEWTHKPVAFVSYGSLAGGTRGVEHLRSSLSWLKMYDLSDQISLPEYYMNLDEDGKFKFNERHENTAHKLLESVIFWAEKMKDARKELSEKAAKTA